MKIRQVGAELFHADGQTYMAKLAAAFRNFVNAPKNNVRDRNIFVYSHKSSLMVCNILQVNLIKKKGASNTTNLAIRDE